MLELSLRTRLGVDGDEVLTLLPCDGVIAGFTGKRGLPEAYPREDRREVRFSRLLNIKCTLSRNERREL
jgi:hypothetical protein